MFNKCKIPDATIKRLSMYSRFLNSADSKGVTTVSSQQIADSTGVTSAQVRKDLAYFGEFGTRGVGYNTKELYTYTMKILGLDRRWPVAIVGAGNLGRALLHYKGFYRRGFDIKYIFDNDPEKIGREIEGRDLKISSMDDLEEKLKECDIKLGIIAVPAKSAQQVADRLIKAGVKGIINFAPINLNLDKEIILRSVDLAAHLEYLTFHLEDL